MKCVSAWCDAPLGVAIVVHADGTALLPGFFCGQWEKAVAEHQSGDIGVAKKADRTVRIKMK